MVRALSIQQPWAWAITDLDKRVENRSRATSYRGGFWIHTSKQYDNQGEHALISALTDAEGEVWDCTDDFDKGAVVGWADLYDCCEPGVPFGLPEGSERWTVGRHLYLLRDVIKFAHPVPAKGALGFFKLPPEVEARCQKELKMAKDAKSKKPGKPAAKSPGEAHEDLGYGTGGTSKTVNLSPKQLAAVQKKIAFVLQLTPKISEQEKRVKAAKKILDGHQDELKKYKQSHKDALAAIPLIAEGKYTPPTETAAMKGMK